MAKIFANFDLSNFWEDSKYARKEYVEAPPTKKSIGLVEEELGVKLPGSYIELMQSQNGGIPKDTCFPTKERTSWAMNHVAITGIMGIGRKKPYSLCGELGSKFMQEEWGYPDFGICICDCPSAGHDMIMLDYRKCGKQGEPEVIHVDQESEYKVTFLAKDFESFILGLVNKSVYDTSAEDLVNALNKVQSGSFSTSLSKLIQIAPDFGLLLRNICRKLTEEKKHFSLHGDQRSYLIYDILFHLFSTVDGVKSIEHYLDETFPDLIVFGDGEFCTGGYAPDFVSKWMSKRLKAGAIVNVGGNFTFSDKFRSRIIKDAKAHG
jgi:hypothetical protein